MVKDELAGKEFTELFRAILQLNNLEDSRKFFRDLCTIKELKEFAERWSVVLLLNTDMSYRKIAKELGVSTATVTRIAHWLNYGRGGYRLALKRLKYRK